MTQAKHRAVKLFHAAYCRTHLRVGGERIVPVERRRAGPRTQRIVQVEERRRIRDRALRPSARLRRAVRSREQHGNWDEQQRPVRW